jgi:hypothetical protein
LDKFKGIAMVQIQDGSTVYLWQDIWNGTVRLNEFPHLYSFTNRTKILVKHAKDIEDLNDIFQLHLTNEAFQHYLRLTSEMSDLSLNNDSDVWNYIWGSDQYSVSKAYLALSRHMPIHPVLIPYGLPSANKNTKFSPSYTYMISLIPETG